MKTINSNMTILHLPNKFLLQKTETVTKVDRSIRDLAHKMIKIKNEGEAVGLAANQIGVDKRLCVIGFKPKDKKEAVIPEITLINPVITWRSKEQVSEDERCLSVDKDSVNVPRAKKIHVQYLDLDGKKQKLKARGLLARIIQHELDHLDGKTIADYK